MTVTIDAMQLQVYLHLSASLDYNIRSLAF